MRCMWRANFPHGVRPLALTISRSLYPLLNSFWPQSQPSLLRSTHLELGLGLWPTSGLRNCGCLCIPVPRMWLTLKAHMSSLPLWGNQQEDGKHMAIRAYHGGAQHKSVIRCGSGTSKRICIISNAMSGLQEIGPRLPCFCVLLCALYTSFGTLCSAIKS